MGRMSELDNLIKKIYQDNISGKLSDKHFDIMLQDFENEQNHLEAILKADKAEIEKTEDTVNNTERFLNLVRKHSDFSVLTPTLLNEFVDRILVHEGAGVGAKRTKEIEIYLNFIGKFIVPKEEKELSPEELEVKTKQELKRAKKRESGLRYANRVAEMTRHLVEKERLEKETQWQRKVQQISNEIREKAVSE